MNYNRWDDKTLWSRQIAIFSCLLLLFVGCMDNKPLKTSEVITDYYPDIAEAITDRNADQLFDYTDHHESEVGDLAWRALAKTEIEDMAGFLNRVMAEDTKPAWFALSFHSLNNEDHQTIRDKYLDGDIQSHYVCEVFRRAGGAEELDLLLHQTENVKEYPICALAVGTILTREPVSTETKQAILQFAFDTGNNDVRNSLLYGFYRSDLNRSDRNSSLYDEFMDRWKQFGIGVDGLTDQYFVEVLGMPGARGVMNDLSDRELEKNLQLSVEVASQFQEADLAESDRNHFNRLMNHRNPQVQIRLLEVLMEYDDLDAEILEKIRTEISGPTRNHELFLTSLQLLLANDYDVSVFNTKLEFTEQESPYLTRQILSIYEQLKPQSEYLERIARYLSKGGIRALHAGQALNDWSQLNDIAAEWRDEIDSLFWTAVRAGDRSSVAGLSGLIRNEELFTDEDYNRLYNQYAEFLERREYENANEFQIVLEERFPDRFEDIEEIADKPFYSPNWERLYEMGTAPHWILETNRGKVEVRLDPLSAPFTVSSIDSLTRSGAYDGVNFHRVVKNFVVQGGDFDRRDGFGGPEYRLPTEPSFRSYKRGMAGIASSGTDSEGSQFFFMHQWAPHLDGDYTLFGEVIRGMDVVDQLQVGDKILEARISVR